MTVSLLILNQIEFDLVQNRRENRHHDHIPFNLNGSINLCFWVYAQLYITLNKLRQRNWILIHSKLIGIWLYTQFFDWILSVSDQTEFCFHNISANCKYNQIVNIYAVKFSRIITWRWAFSSAQTGKTTTNRRIAVRETGISWHQGGPIKDPPETPYRLQHYRIEGFEGSTELVPHYAERWWPLVQPMWDFPAWNWAKKYKKLIRIYLMFIYILSRGHSEKRLYDSFRIERDTIVVTV